MRAAALRLQTIHQLHQLEAMHAQDPRAVQARLLQSLAPEATEETADASLDKLYAQAQARQAANR